MTSAPPWVRPAALVAAVLGAAWGVPAALGALEVIGRGPLLPVDGRGGEVIGIVALVLAGTALAGAVAVLRRPAVAAALLFIASFAGVLAIGAAWVGPAAFQLLGALLALWAVPNPFAGEMRDRPGSRGGRAHGRPGM